MKARLRHILVAGALTLSLALAVAVFLPERAQAEDPVSERLISVTGEASISVKPDMATISFGVESNGNTAKEAQQANTANMNAVIAALKRSGVADADIQTSNFSLYPVYEWEGDKIESQQVLTGYRCNNTVTAKVKALDSVGNIIDSAVTAGATNVGGISFGLQNPEPKKSEALAEAVLDAREKADIMAKAAKVTVTGIQKMSDGWASVDSIEGYGARKLMDSATPIEGGTVSVRATVRIDFTF